MSVIIGSRWTPSAIERRDSGTGAYEYVNSPFHNDTELSIQTALLSPKSRGMFQEEIDDPRLLRLYAIFFIGVVTIGLLFKFLR